MPALSTDDRTRLTTKAEGLRARVRELEESIIIEPGTKAQMINVRRKQIAEIEALLKGAEAPK